MSQVEYTTREAMARSGFSRQHIYDLISRGRIKARCIVMFGVARHMIDKASLEEYLNGKQLDKRHTRHHGPKS